VYRHWVNKDGKATTGKYHDFKTWRVYWAFLWYQARETDRYNAITPIKKQWGNVIEKTNYENKYL
jgi:hypothetical protein